MIRYNEPRFKELRLDNNLKQEDVAKILKVKRSTYSKWENFTNDISLRMSNNLASYYKVTLDYLMGLSHTKVNILKCNKINYHLLKERLKSLRKENKLTQKELSEKLGFYERTYANYEKGIRIPTTFKLFIIARFYEVSLDYLMGRLDSKEILTKL